VIPPRHRAEQVLCSQSSPAGDVASGGYTSRPHPVECT
jgi:hypothetical protein